MRRPVLLDLVASLVHAARRPEIVRVDTIHEGVHDLTGLRVTTIDGNVYTLRVLEISGGREPVIAPRPPNPSVVSFFGRPADRGRRPLSRRAVPTTPKPPEVTMGDGDVTGTARDAPGF